MSIAKNGQHKFWGSFVFFFKTELIRFSDSRLESKKKESETNEVTDSLKRTI